MWIEDLTKTLYFLNATDYKWAFLISRIEDNIIYFTNGKWATVEEFVAAYNLFIKTGEIMNIFEEE